MSDWNDIPPNPTLAIQFPWNRAPLITCLNCGERVSNMYAKRHALVDRDTDGCGIVFEYVTTAAADETWRRHVRETRDDLQWKEVQFA